MRARRRRPGLRRLAQRLAAAFVLAQAAPAGVRAAEPEPFRPLRLAVEGRPVEVVVAREGGGAEGAASIAVATSRGAPPDEERHVSLFRFETGAASGRGSRPDRTLAVPTDVVAFDVGDALPHPGVEVALLSATALRLEASDPAAAPSLLRFEKPLPLPRAVRGLARLALLANWRGRATSALLPHPAGLQVVELPEGGSRQVEVPVLADYLGEDPHRVGREGLLASTLAWPRLEWGDDDGDGRRDLFVLSRYAILVLRPGAAGWPEPARRIALRPFTAQEELRPETTSLRLFAQDLDGDGLTDLVVHRAVGTLLRSRVHTELFRNRGQGADPTGAPDLTLEADGGFGSLALRDLDGDGRLEILQTWVPFGVVQGVRILLTRAVEARLRVLRLAGPGLSAAEISWESELRLPLDFEASRVAGLLPSAEGDWNGDGRADLLQPDGAEGIVLRLGEAGPRGPAFGAPVGRQRMPPAEHARVADLDGDGLDDLVVWDPRREAHGVHVLRNRGVLPGTPPGLRPGAGGGGGGSSSTHTGPASRAGGWASMEDAVCDVRTGRPGAPRPPLSAAGRNATRPGGSPRDRGACARRSPPG